MKHLGDITKLSGGDVPAANVVIGGSPCQDLSIAGGKRAGLAGGEIRAVHGANSVDKGDAAER